MFRAIRSMRGDHFPAADRNIYIRRRGIGHLFTEHLSGMDVFFFVHFITMKGKRHEFNDRRLLWRLK